MVLGKKLFSLLILLFLFNPAQTGNAPEADGSPPFIDDEALSATAVYKAPETVTLFASGDNLIHNSVYEAARSDSRNYDFKPFFRFFHDDIKNADIAFCNQETILGGTQIGLSSYPQFNSPQELGQDLLDMGYSVINHGTNHIFDRGTAGVRNTLDFWRDKPAIVLGVTDGTIPAIQYKEIKGVKFAFLGYTYGTNGLTLPKNSPYSVNLIDFERIDRESREAAENADIVIVSMHWGEEYSFEVNSEQRRIAEMLAKNNVSLIIGHHPHVIEPVDTLTRSDGKKMPVFYSLGNFISAQYKAESMVGAVAKVTFSGGEAVHAEFIPVINHYEAGFRNAAVYPFSDYTKELAAVHGAILRDSRFSYNFVEKLIERNPVNLELNQP